MSCLFWSAHTDGAGRRRKITLQRTFLGCGPFAGFTEFFKLKKINKFSIFYLIFLSLPPLITLFWVIFSFLCSAGSRELHLFAVRTCSWMEPMLGGTNASDLPRRDLQKTREDCQGVTSGSKLLVKGWIGLEASQWWNSTVRFKDQQQKKKGKRNVPGTDVQVRLA